jgi:xanthine phosphoribosyltransferase
MILKACFASLFLLFDCFDFCQVLNRIWEKSKYTLVIFFIGGNMKLLEDRILNDGNVLGENILKVDSFLTHQVDFDLMREIGKVFAEKFKDAGITKVVTIEASGIAPALYAAEALNVPMIFAKKAKNITMNEGILTAEVYSFTKQVTSTVSIASKFLTPEDKVLIVDDFLANGQAAKGLIQIIEEAGAHVEAVGIVIEKSFQDGRALLEEAGYPVVSLARLDRFENGQVVFKEADI